MYSSGSTLNWYSQTVVSEEFPEGLVTIPRTNPWLFMGHECESAVPRKEQDTLNDKAQMPISYIMSLNSIRKPIFHVYSFKMSIFEGTFKRKATWILIPSNSMGGHSNSSATKPPWSQLLQQPGIQEWRKPVKQVNILCQWSWKLELQLQRVTVDTGKNLHSSIIPILPGICDLLKAF